jgi:hypothetical protein
MDVKTAKFEQNPLTKTPPGGPANSNTDRDTADLTKPEFPALNRFSNPNLHSHAQM